MKEQKYEHRTMGKAEETLPNPKEFYRRKSQKQTENKAEISRKQI